MSRKIKGPEYWDKEHFDIHSSRAHFKMKSMAIGVIVAIIVGIALLIGYYQA